MTVPTPPLFPRPLRPGDLAVLAAPAGAIEAERLNWAKAALEARGLRVSVRGDITDTHRYMAGSDDRRAQELADALTNPEVKAVFLARGGYGGQRLIERLEAGEFKSQKTIIGFSDNTILLNYFRRARGWAVLHAPHPDMEKPEELDSILEELDSILALLGLGLELGEGGEAELPRFSGLKLWNAGVAGPGGGKIEAEVAGGCLSLLAASQGAPWAFRADGRIVFIEDVNEAVYRIDRMLNQLTRAGALQDAAAVVFGRLESFVPEGGRLDHLFHLVDEFARSVSFPVLSGLPCGHTTPNRPLPFGPKALLDPAAGTLCFSEPFAR